MSFPALAEKIENTPKYRRSLAIGCMILGFLGIVFDASQKRSGDQQTRQLVANTNTLVGSTNNLVTSANQTVTTLGLLMPQVTGLQDQIRTYATNSEIARKQGNERLAAALQTQADLARQQANIVKRQYLINIAPRIGDQMQTAYDDWMQRETSARHQYPKGKYDPQYFKDSESLAQQYTASLKPTMVNANSVREQLLDTVPVEVQKSLSYPQIVPVFESGITGQTIHVDELGRAMGYLRKLVRIISALPPQTDQ